MTTSIPAPPDLSRRGRNAGIVVAVSCISLVGVGLSLSIPLLAFALQARGQSGTFIGLNTAVGGFATLVVAPLIPLLSARVGVRPLLLGSIVLAAVTILGFAVVEPLWAWFPLRFAFGAALTTLFVLSEFWINAAAPPKSRGFVMGVYATALSLGFAAGPAILSLTGMDSLAPYAAGAALFLVAAVPLMLAGGGAPLVERPALGRGILFFIRVAPLATLAGFTFGAVETGAFTFLPLYGTRLGLVETAAALLVSLTALGNVVSQIPIGIVSDRVDRRRLLFAIGVAGTVGAAAMPAASSFLPAFFVLACVWGGLVAGLYTVGLAYLGERFSGADLATANAAFVIMYSSGAMAGPLIVGLGLDLWDPHGVPVSIAAIVAFYVVIAGWRTFRARPTP